MVLKSLQLVLMLSVLFTGAPEGRLLSQYKTKVHKKLSKTFEIAKTVDLKQIKSKEATLELYQITSQFKLIGYVALKEVKSCSLNGCTSNAPNIESLASEYYDIAVFVDPDLSIRQISVLDYFSDYGYEISSKRYLKQYEGSNLKDFSLNTPQVDGISGATISYNALIVSLEEIGKAISN